MRVKYNFSSKFTQKQRKPSYTNQHRVPFTKMAQEVIETSDIILEILDARFIEKTRNPEIEKEVRKLGKKIIFVLNKADLVDVKELKFNYDLTQIRPYVLFSTKSRIGRLRLREILSVEASKSKFKKARVGVIGYPNTGKSSIINVLSGGRRAGVSPRAGFTKNIQNIKFRKNIIIIDTPGVITGGEENSIIPQIVKKQAEIGVKNFDKVKYPDLILNDIMKENPGIFDEHYEVDSGNDIENLLDILGRKWDFLKKRGVIDQDRTARKILKEWQDGKIRKKILAA